MYQGGAQRWIDAPPPTQEQRKHDHSLNWSVDGVGEEAGGRGGEGGNEGAGFSSVFDAGAASLENHHLLRMFSRCLTALRLVPYMAHLIQV